ncbi:uncharacterized protein DNG_07608 [Cephalotrichum gorgonifer]|uniref:Uncharacterized protein n=1 Tax=Cephalotrichum gorgonifer TaxID=2041049 RepID=A0AAE8N3V4_9PEZI|nr:uncharacterized protein DNG_07608 [Cephalotrichum gorgonifer]
MLRRIALALLLAALTTADSPPFPSPTDPGFPVDVYQACGGLVPEPESSGCQEPGTTCISDPRKPGCGLACDERGICVSEEVPRCGGYAGLQCPEDEGLECFDDASDDCDPENGGFDCMGICLTALE